VRDWRPEEVIGHLEPEPALEGGFSGRCPQDAGVLLLLMLAGHRMSWAVDVDTGLLPGWHRRARAWWGEGAEAGPTLLSLGFCDATGLVRGDTSGFVEMFEAAMFPAHMVHVSEHPLVSCAPFLLEQFLRTPAQNAAIAADLGRALVGAGPASPTHWGMTPTPDDLIFAGALLAQLTHSPMRETYDLLGSAGLTKRGPAEAVLLSVAAEPRTIRRHRTLGYRLHILDHDLRASGRGMRAWLENAFETLPRTLHDIRRDLVDLIDTVGAATGARFLIVNQMSTSGREDISTYAPFDAPMRDTLATISAKEVNLMLHDIAEMRDIVIIDVDAAAADIGGAAHVPDGVHQSGEMQAKLREAILDSLVEFTARTRPGRLREQ
jgi:hypothetical protein